MIFNFVLLPIAIVATGIFFIWVSIRRMRSPFVRMFRCGEGLPSVSCCQLSFSPLIAVGVTSSAGNTHRAQAPRGL